MIRYVIGDATHPQDDGNKLIVHVCNDVGAWGRGFVIALNQRWKTPEKRYREWYRNRATAGFGLGAVQFVHVERFPDLWIANVIAQAGLIARDNVQPFRVDALARAFVYVREFALKNRATVHMPRIGCGLGGAKWEIVEPVIKTELDDFGVDVTVYDLRQS